MEKNQNRVAAGVPTGGQFAGHDRAEGDAIAMPAPTPDHDAMQRLVTLVHAVRGPMDRPATWGDLADAADRESDPIFATGVRARAEREGAENPLPRHIVRHASGMFLDATAEQHVAAEHLHDRLTEHDSVGHYSRADYADVTDDGIAYGFTFPPHILAEVTGVTIGADESIDDYMERVQKAEPDYCTRVSEALKAQYGCDAVNDGSDYDTFEFFVPYPEDGGPDNEGGAAAVTIEWMGDRAEATTKLLAFKNDLEYGTRMQSVVAKALGRKWELTTNPDRRFGDGHWVKDD